MSIDTIIKITESIVINCSYGFCFTLGISIMSQGIMEYLDWKTWNGRDIQKITDYSVKIGLGFSIAIIFLKLYLTR